jgi:hypothetical protein
MVCEYMLVLFQHCANVYIFFTVFPDFLPSCVTENRLQTHLLVYERQTQALQQQYRLIFRLFYQIICEIRLLASSNTYLSVLESVRMEQLD